MDLTAILVKQGANQAVQVKIARAAGVAGEVKLAAANLPRGVTAAEVVIAADKNVKYEVVVNVMDRLQRAGVQRVGLSVQVTK